MLSTPLSTTTHRSRSGGVFSRRESPRGQAPTHILTMSLNYAPPPWPLPQISALFAVSRTSVPAPASRPRLSGRRRLSIGLSCRLLRVIHVSYPVSPIYIQGQEAPNGGRRTACPANQNDLQVSAGVVVGTIPHTSAIATPMAIPASSWSTGGSTRRI